MSALLWWGLAAAGAFAAGEAFKSDALLSFAFGGEQPLEAFKVQRHCLLPNLWTSAATSRTNFALALTSWNLQYQSQQLRQAPLIKASAKGHGAPNIGSSRVGSPQTSQIWMVFSGFLMISSSMASTSGGSGRFRPKGHLMRVSFSASARRVGGLDGDRGSKTVAGSRVCGGRR